MNNKYRSLISKSDSEKQLESLDFTTEEASQQMQADILATKKEIASAKRDLEESKSAVPFSPKKAIEKQMELEAYEKGLSLLLALNEELFKDEVDTTMSAAKA
jgi:hypothetical protein